MKRLFNFKRVRDNVIDTISTLTPEVKTYTAADVTADLTAKMLLFFEEVRECIEHKQGDAVQLELSRLNKLGLSNTANAELLKKAETQIAEYNKKVDALKFMQHAWNKYGKDVMVVSYAHFMEILEKYDLVCGSLDRYTGIIPEDNIKEIEKLHDMHSKCEIDENEAYKFETVEWINTDSITDLDSIIKFARFPFHIEGISILETYQQMGIPDLRSIAELYSLNRIVYGHNFIQTELLDEQGDVITSTIQSSPVITPKLTNPFNAQFFIAAPCEEMKPVKFSARLTFFDDDKAKKAFDKFQSLAKYCELVETKDPFICSCTPYGVMIFSKWGDESHDEIIKRYQELSDMVNFNKAIE